MCSCSSSYLGMGVDYGVYGTSYSDYMEQRSPSDPYYLSNRNQCGINSYYNGCGAESSFTIDRSKVKKIKALPKGIAIDKSAPIDDSGHYEVTSTKNIPADKNNKMIIYIIAAIIVLMVLIYFAFGRKKKSN